jgi:hypothetical protein
MDKDSLNTGCNWSPNHFVTDFIVGFVTILCIVRCEIVWGQNVVPRDGANQTAPPISISIDEARSWIETFPDFSARAEDPASERTRAKLDNHIGAFIDGQPWMPLHITLGISGYESYFTHPDETWYALTLAMSQLSGETATRLRGFLRDQLEAHPPYTAQPYPATTGSARESYDVPPALRRTWGTLSSGALGVYAFAAWCHAGGDRELAAAHWPAVLERMRSLLDDDYVFDVYAIHLQDEAETLNRDLAGLIGLVRLAHQVDDTRTAERALTQARRLFELRINLERVNTNIFTPTPSSSHRGHNGKLARYASLVPEVALAVAQRSAGCAEAHLSAFREPRNGWFMAFGDRYTGGENYISPPHVARAMFTGTALIERLPAEALHSFLDVPWCPGDLYFIEKCVFALHAAASASTVADGKSEYPDVP